MEKGIVDYINSHSGEYEIAFNGFDSAKDLLRIKKYIEAILKPDQLEFHGSIFDEMNGFFVKENLKVIFHYDPSLGNDFRFSGELTEENKNRIRSWAQTIFHLLQKEEK